MRVFWALILLLAITGGAVLAISGHWFRSDTERAKTLIASEAAKKERMAIDSMIAAEAASDEYAKKAEADRKTNETKQGTSTTAQQASPAASTPPAPTPTNTTGSGSLQLESPKPTEAAPAVTIGNPLATPEFTTPAKTTATDSGKSATPAPADDAKPYEIEPQKIEHRDDGTLLVDGKFVIKGEGTAEKPYEVTWELLLSAEATFQPKQKSKKIPEAVAMLDDKFVKIGGYVAFPLMVQTPKECLIMLNQWDGCCIGVPPTPFDAIEARLKKAVNGEARYATSGTITGRLGVKPYLTGDWLVGLYLLEDGELDSRAFGGYGGN
jgi:hypothetical protein